MRFLNTTAVLLGLAASVCAAPKPAVKHAAKMSAKTCAAACTKSMKAKGMKGSCSVAMCKSGQCPMMAKGSKTHPMRMK